MSKTLIELFKIAVALCVGAFVGLLLGLAYAAHLYGTPPVVLQLLGVLAGDNLYDSPMPVDATGDLMQTPAILIPRISAIIGASVALLILLYRKMVRQFILKDLDSAASAVFPAKRR